MASANVTVSTGSGLDQTMEPDFNPKKTPKRFSQWLGPETIKCKRKRQKPSIKNQDHGPPMAKYSCTELKTKKEEGMVNNSVGWTVLIKERSIPPSSRTRQFHAEIKRPSQL
ncbi:hypothetical protein ACLOJK_040167 [Asimina triloba]